MEKPWFKKLKGANLKETIALLDVPEHVEEVEHSEHYVQVKRGQQQWEVLHRAKQDTYKISPAWTNKHDTGTFVHAKWFSIWVLRKKLKYWKSNLR